jgi:hypothetical protein
MPIHRPVLDDRSFDDVVSELSSSARKLTFGDSTQTSDSAVGMHEITGALVKINLIDTDETSDHIEIYELNFGTQVGSEGVVAHDVDHIGELQLGEGDDFFL